MLVSLRPAVVVNKFIQDKAGNASKRQSIRCIDAESTPTMEVDRLRDGGSMAQRSGSSRFSAKPLVLHDRVFKVSLAPTSVFELRQWIVKAASGRECPPGFNFPAVDQTISKAWIEAYDAMEVVRGIRPCVLWSRAVEEFRKKMSGSLPDADDAGRVLLRAMQHREAEGGVLLSLADDSAPVATDMVHLDPSWLIELVRRLADHNLVDKNKKKRGSLEQGLRVYAKRQGLAAAPLVDIHK